ncbi:MAG: hypothetical protein IJN40_05165 [Clostridia bacterium]|nr:hypothetical protein [Clostridia bacterium]
MASNIMEGVITSVICLGITTLVGVIGYFLKQTMGRMAAAEKEIKEIRQTYEPVKSHEKDMEKINEKLESIDLEVKGFKNVFLEKEDFIRSMAEINHKFDRMDDKLDRLISLMNKEAK